MALEDEIINIEDLDIAKEIKIGDYVLLETTDGTKLIDFKDFIIGTDNITFYYKISGGDFLQTADISALSANVATNTSILTGISGLDTDVNGLRDYVDLLASDLSRLRASINELSDVTLETFTSGTVGFGVSRNSVSDQNPVRSLFFPTLDFKGTDLTEATSGNGSISIGNSTSGFQYIAKGTYNIFLIGNMEFTGRSNDVLQIMKNEEIVYQFDLKMSTRIGLYANVGLASLIRCTAGDKITFTTKYGVGRFRSGNIIGTIL